jgi:hypothetical protein
MAFVDDLIFTAYQTIYLKCAFESESNYEENSSNLLAIILLQLGTHAASSMQFLKVKVVPYQSWGFIIEG